MRYSFNLDRKDVIFAQQKDIDASFKDLCAVADFIRYKNVIDALADLDSVIEGRLAVPYRRHNKYMGSRHELAGRKGRFPRKCAGIIRKVLVNAVANARGTLMVPEYMYVVHIAANKTQIIPRLPSKGVRAVRGGHSYGPVSLRRSNMELAKVEVGISSRQDFGGRASRALKAVSRNASAKKPVPEKAKAAAQQKRQPKAAASASPAKKGPAPAKVEVPPAEKAEGGGAKAVMPDAAAVAQKEGAKGQKNE